MPWARATTAYAWQQDPAVKRVQKSLAIQIDPKSRFDMLATLFPVESDVWYSNGLESLQWSMRRVLGGAPLASTRVS